MARPDESVVHGSKAPSSPSDPTMLLAAPKDLPSVDRLLRQAAVQALIAEHGHTLPAQQAGLDRQSIGAWSAQSTWLGLEVESSEVFGGQPEHAFVTFTARWHDSQGEHSHRERSSFVQNAGRWYFIDPTVQLKLGRNDSCPCASGQKFKKCCAGYFGA